MEQHQAIKWQARMVQLLSVFGIVVAFYLVLFHDGALVQSGCQIGQFWDCSSVSGPTAQYSAIAEVSVAKIGLFGYVMIFLMVWLSDFITPLRHNLRELLFAVVTLGLIFSSYLTYLEAFVLKAWCLYCVVSAGNILIMFLLSIWHLRDRST